MTTRKPSVFPTRVPSRAPTPYSTSWKPSLLPSVAVGSGEQHSSSSDVIIICTISSFAFVFGLFLYRYLQRQYIFYKKQALVGSINGYDSRNNTPREVSSSTKKRSSSIHSKVVSTFLSGSEETQPCL